MFTPAKEVHQMLLLSHVPPEERTLSAHFLAGLGRDVETMRCFYFGKCNYVCPGCKEHLDSGAKVTRYDAREVIRWCEDAIHRGQRIRLLGGDPCMHPKESLYIAQWAAARGRKITLAHNGSSPAYIRMMAPYLAHAGIDLKGSNPTQYAKVAGLPTALSTRMISNTLEIIHTLCEADVLVDVRQVVPSWVTVDELRETARLVSEASDNRAFLTLRQYTQFKGDEPFRPFATDALMSVLEALSREFPKLAMGVNEAKNFTIMKNGQTIYCSESCFHAANRVS